MLNNHLSAINNKVLTPQVQALSGGEFISQLLRVLVTGVLVIGSVVFVFMLLFGGLRWITAGGDKGQLESARGTVMNALIGIIVLFAVFAIVTVVENIFGINILNIDLDPLRIA